MNDEMFRLALIDITNDDLLNDFVNDIFGYDFDLKRKEYVYIQYKIVDDNIILNIYDNKNSNRFKAYIFTLNDIDSDENFLSRIASTYCGTPDLWLNLSLPFYYFFPERNHCLL